MYSGGVEGGKTKYMYSGGVEGGKRFVRCCSANQQGIPVTGATHRGPSAARGAVRGAYPANANAIVFVRCCSTIQQMCTRRTSHQHQANYTCTLLPYNQVYQSRARRAVCPHSIRGRSTQTPIRSCSYQQTDIEFDTADHTTIANVNDWGLVRRWGAPAPQPPALPGG